MNIQLPIIGTADKRYTIHPGKIIAIGLNYTSHIEESESIKVRGLNSDVPQTPVFFNKTPNVLIGPGANIVIPLCLNDYPWHQEARTDYEGELVIIMGRTGKHIGEKDALSHIYGYTCGNDVSQRNLQNSDRAGWFRGKSFDTFGPVGPCILPAGTSVNPQSLNIETRLNGKTVQSSNTSRMIFPIPRLISYLSRQITLNEGDLIFTGTPSGVGPLTPGDTVEVEIEHIGILANTVVTETLLQ
ncbi:MAG: hypothetical protein B0D92_00435 [Spirochaeta sp. LUC14_002_19_P3]|nr:MAG: hypothetical protein B0D92_00435 [Spirochaeta sp. LUC14_002_19_P3]